MNSKISVIMPVYNGEKYLREAIDSVLNQTFRNFEFIIIDDGSSDSSAEIINSYNDPRIKYFKKENSGIADSLNFGIDKSQGEFIARMDCDDICMPNRFERQIKFFEENPELVLVASWATEINSIGEETEEIKYPPLKWKKIKRYGLLHNPFIHPTTIFRKDLIKIVGNYSLKFLHNEDYELWTRVIYKYPCMNIDEKLIKYRTHENSVTRKNNFSMRYYGLKVRILAFFRFIFGAIL